MSSLFVMLIAYSLATEGGHIAQRSSRTTPDQIATNPLFAEPGVRLTAPNKFQVTGVAQAFSFNPGEIRLPVGAEVDFFLTSKDVIHGFQIEDTNINVEVLPGEISYLTYTFDTVGEYLLFCNEYCGISHQNMLGKVVVVPASQFTQVAQTTASPGEQVYNGNCAACHQASGEGVAGAFPALKGHANKIYEAGGRDYLINTVLYGLQGPIEVSGATYNGIMPAWSQLSNENLADALNHILTTWETPADFKPYEASEIEALRTTPLSATDVLDLRQTLNLGGQ
jgi:cytochrome c oxidase subunit 2